MISAREVIADFRERVMIPDLANSTPVQCHASTISKRWLSWKVKLLDAAMEVLT